MGLSGRKSTADDPAQTIPLHLLLTKMTMTSCFSPAEINAQIISAYLMIRDENIIQKALPCSVHGNEVGRATGDRLIYKNGRLYFGSQTAGIIYSEDMGESWQSIDLFGEKNISLIWTDSDGQTFYRRLFR